MLGKVEQVDLRSIWKHEASDFTNWLAEAENFQALADKVGIDMQVLKTEANVGSFSADILAEESNTGKKIIIENQLEITNHDHLGKLITYASGLEASYVIWIFKEIREEHRRAIDWLNEVTDEELNIFAIKMEVWKIGESVPAPVFNVICAPNGWQKAYKRNSSSAQNLTDGKLLQLEFWQGYAEYISKHRSPFKACKASPQHWYNISIGTSQAHFSFIASVKEHFVRIDLYIPNNKELYSSLFAHKQEIESDLDYSLDWQDLPNSKASRIALRKDNINVENENDKKEAYKWLLDNATKIYNATKKYLK